MLALFMRRMTDVKTHIFVTGASRGIGKAILDSFDADDIEAIGHSTSGEGSLLKSDFANVDNVSGLWQDALDQLDGRIDVLINNAGIFDPNPIAGSDADWLESWSRTMQINLNASALLCRLAVRHFQERRATGRIVNIASEEILAFAICPGFTMTGMAEDYLESRGGDKLLQDIPLGRVAQPEEIASMAKYCALDAPPSMTGAVLDANGASFVR